MLCHNIVKIVFVHHDRLYYVVDVTNTFPWRPICMMFTLRYNDILDVISKQKVVELVTANQGLGVTVNTSDELDICLLSDRLFLVRQKQLDNLSRLDSLVPRLPQTNGM